MRDVALDAGMRGVAQARASGDGPVLARALRWYAKAALEIDAFDAAQEALTEAEAIPGSSPRLRHSLLEARAQLSHMTGDLDAAAAAFASMLEVQRVVGNVRNVCVGTVRLASIELMRGRPSASAEMLGGVLPTVRNGVDRRLYSTVAANLAFSLLADDDPDGALNVADEMLSISGELISVAALCTGIETIAIALTSKGDCHRAAMLGGFADATASHHQLKRSHVEQSLYDRNAMRLAERIAPEELMRLRAEGAALALEAAIALAREAVTASRKLGNDDDSFA
jgi:tetratricopeptide (TPR) repeat protein